MKSNCRIPCSQVTRCIRNLRFWKNANPNRSRSGASLKCVLAEYSRKEKSSSTMREASWCTSALTLPNRNSFRKFVPNERSECKPDRAQPSRNAERSVENYPSRAFGRARPGFGSFRGWTSLHEDSGRHGGGGHQDREAGDGRFDSQLGLGGARPFVGLRLAQWQQAKLHNRREEESRLGGGPSPNRKSRCCSGKLCARRRRAHGVRSRRALRPQSPADLLFLVGLWPGRPLSRRESL